MRSPLLLALAAVGVVGCGNISFDVEQDIPATVLPGDPNQMPIVGDTPPQPLTLDIKAETDQRHTGPASAAYLKELTFTITRPANGTFYFAVQVQIYLQPKNPASNLPKVLIAKLEPIPDTNTIRLVPVPGVNMLPYSDEGSDITASAAGYNPMVDTEYVGHVVVEVRI
jgi:hypothetical protein